MIKQENYKTTDLYKSLVNKVMELNSLTEKERLDLVYELNLGNFKSHYSDKFQKKKEFLIDNLPILPYFFKNNKFSKVLKVVSEPKLTFVGSLSGQFETFLTVSRLTSMQFDDFVLIVFDEVKENFMKILEVIKPFDEIICESSKLKDYLNRKKDFENLEEINNLLKLRFELESKLFYKINADNLFSYSNELYNKTISLMNKEFNLFFIADSLNYFYEFRLNKRSNFIGRLISYDPLTMQFIIDSLAFRSKIFSYLESRKKELSFKNKLLLNLELKRLRKNGYLNSYRLFSSTPITSGGGFLMSNVNSTETIILGFK